MNRRVEKWRDRFPLELVEKRYRGCGQEPGKRCASKSISKRTAPRSLECHFDDESDLAEFVSFALAVE